MEATTVSVLFVCTGNLSRSPLCQGLFEHKLRLLKASNIRVDSAGVATAPNAQWGSPPFEGSVHYAKKLLGINIAHQRSRRVSTITDSAFDYIVAMEQDNVTSLCKDYGISEKVYKLRYFETKVTPVVIPNISTRSDIRRDVILDVPDPWGGSQKLYEQTLEIMNDCLNNFITFLAERHPHLQLNI